MPAPSGWRKSKTAWPLLDRLKRKYGKTVAEVIAFGEDVARQLAEVEDRDEILKKLRAELEAAAADYRKEAGALSEQRKTAAAKLAKLAEQQINSLAMKVKFEIAVHQRRSRGTAGPPPAGTRSNTASPPTPASR